MPSIVSYQKYIDSQITRELRLPFDPETHHPIGTELATIDGVTYVSLPDGVTLPADQPAEIADSIKTVTLTDALKEQIKAASPHCRLINDRMQQRIREVYSADAEQYYARIGVGAALGAYTFRPGEQEELADYIEDVEAVRQWGREERAKLGL